MDWHETPEELARAWAEQPVIMPGEHGHLYGIFTPPAPEASSRGLCVILLGRNRWWSDRLSVKSARWLATRGFPCLRFDYHGYGESDGASEFLHTERPYSDDAVAAIRYMRQEFGQQRFVLTGFCFDARTALSAAEQEGAAIEAIVGVSAVPGDKLTHLTIHKLVALLNMPFSVKRYVFNLALRRRLHRLLPRWVSHPENSKRSLMDENSLAWVSESFKQEFHAVVKWRIRCLLIYGRDDGEYYNFRQVERLLLRKLAPEQRALFTIEVWPGKVHVAHDPDRQRQITEHTLLWIDGFRQPPLHFAQPEFFVVPETSNGARA